MIYPDINYIFVTNPALSHNLYNRKIVNEDLQTSSSEFFVHIRVHTIDDYKNNAINNVQVYPNNPNFFCLIRLQNDDRYFKLVFGSTNS